MRSTTRAGMLVLVALSLFVTASESKEVSLVDQVHKTLGSEDSWAIAELVEAEGSDPKHVVRLYRQLVKDLYDEKRDPTAMLIVGRAGINYALYQSAMVKDDARLAKRFKYRAREIAFELGVRTWSGRGDKDIQLRACDVALGRDVVLLHMRLAKELLSQTQSPLIVDGHWLLGVHALDARDYVQARRSFVYSEEHAAFDGDSPRKLRSQGYLGLTEYLAGDSKVGLEGIKSALKALDGLKGKTAYRYAGELRTALSVYSTRK